MSFFYPKPHLTNPALTASLLVYLLGGLFVSSSFVFIFIITITLLAIDFYYLKNIAGRRLVGLRWWNEVNIETGDSTWVFESAGGRGESGNKTDSRFFWLALYVQPALWVGLAITAILKFSFVWLSVIGKCLSNKSRKQTGVTGSRHDFGRVGNPFVHSNCPLDVI